MADDKDDEEGRTNEPGTESLKRVAISRKPCSRGGAAGSSTREAADSAGSSWWGCIDPGDVQEQERGGRSKLVSSITASGQGYHLNRPGSPSPYIPVSIHLYWTGLRENLTRRVHFLFILVFHRFGLFWGLEFMFFFSGV